MGWNLSILFILFALEAGYIFLARRFNIIDKPNNRSSHVHHTVRGGGIIFPLAVLLYAVFSTSGFPAFFAGLALVAGISFWDDIKSLSSEVRFTVQSVAIMFLLYQCGLLNSEVWYWGILLYVCGISLLNVYNFMDGINGMTALYSFTVLGGLYYCNTVFHFINDQYLTFLLLANIVFSFFNLRKKAVCFAGDVGSVSLFFCLFFPVILLMITANSILPLMFFAMYIIDGFTTILLRLRNGENISQPHRKHIYQLLANEKRIPHLKVSSIYMGIQLIISVGVILLLQKDWMVQFAFAISALIVLLSLYFFVLGKVNPRTIN